MFKAIVLFGLPGAGKSTVAKELCRLTHSVHFDSDSFARKLLAAGLDIEGAFHTSLGQIMEILGDEPTEHCSLIISDSFSRAESWNQLFELKRSRNICITLIKVECSTETALSRVGQRGGSHIMQNDDVSIGMAQEFYSNQNQEHFTVWNGEGSDIDEVVRKVMKLSALDPVGRM